MAKRACWIAPGLVVLAASGGTAQQVLAEHGRTGTPAGSMAGVERQAYVMGTRLGLAIDGPTAPEAAEASLTAVRAVEAMLSTWRAESELAALNEASVGARHRVTGELLAILEEVGVWVSATDGAFDPAIGALLEAWGVRGEGRTPTSTELAGARKASGWQRIMVEPDRSAVTRTVRGVRLDAGGFGKGLALRRAAAELRSAGATGVLNFGGQVMVVGTRPERVEVSHPSRRAVGVAELELTEASAATTSASERGDHVLDPRTGRPVAPWGSVTVVARDPMVADILSTALFVMGPEAALAWAWDRSYGILVQQLDADGEPSLLWNPAMAGWLVSVPGSERARPSEPQLSGAAQDTSEIDRLRRQVEAITRELERMRLGADVVARADTGVLGFGPAASKVYQVDEGVSVGGYGEILFRVLDDRLEDGTRAPAANVFDALRGIVYLGYRFNDRLLVNTEIEIEHGNEAFLEFAYLDYRLSDALGLRGGLLLSPMGLVNELHEPPVFLGTTRPLVEQHIIPTTWRENGIGIFGDLGSISYRAYAMNGLEGIDFGAGGLRGGRQKGSRALAEDVAGVVRVDFTGTPGLLAGGSVYYGGSGQEATTPEGAPIQANTLIWEGHASFQSRGLDVRALVAGATVDEAGELFEAAAAADPGATPVAERMGGGYAHLGYNVLRSMNTSHQLFPFVRYEWLDTELTVSDGVTPNPASERAAVLLGASWKPVPQVAIKGDYQIHSNQGDSGRNEFALVISYLF